MTDQVPSMATCHVCDTPDGDHLDWCTPQAREQRPSKDRVSELIEQWGAYKQWLESGGREIEHSTAYAMTGDTIAALKDVVRLREDCRRWENARNVWMAEEKRLKAQVSRLKGYICVTALAGYRCAACAARLTAQPSKPAHEREMPHCSTCSCPPYPAPEPAAESALRNCLLMAMRQLHVKHPDSLGYKNWEHIVRFCKEGGVEPSPLRAAQPPREECPDNNCGLPGCPACFPPRHAQ